MSNVTKFLLLAFSLGITVLLIIYFKRVADTGFESGNIAMEKLSDYNKELSESDITMYEGEEVRGSDVINFIKKHLGSYDAAEVAPFIVYVDTASSEVVCQNNSNLQYMQDFSKTLYVKPVAVFECSITRDANDVINGITFVQK